MLVKVKKRGGDKRAVHKRRRKPRPVSRKYGCMERIDGAIKLGRICSAFYLPFEAIKVYRAGTPVRVKNIIGADRLLVRMPWQRFEVVLRGASLPQLKAVADSITDLTSRKSGSDQRFMLQKVGLRQTIKAYGSITIEKGMKGTSVYYAESPYKSREEAPPGKFVTGDNTNGFLAGTGSRNDLGLEKGRLSQEAGKVLAQKFGTKNAVKMTDHILQRMENGTIAEIRFARYQGKIPWFYDMTIRHFTLFS